MTIMRRVASNDEADFAMFSRSSIIVELRQRVIRFGASLSLYSDAMAGRGVLQVRQTSVNSGGSLFSTSKGNNR
jgi:hypothetical protein